MNNRSLFKARRFFFIFVQKSFFHAHPARSAWKPPNRRRPARANEPWTSSFRMTLFALARSVTNRRADGGHSDSSLFNIPILPMASSERWPTSARHSVSSVYSVDYKRFVFIRVHSWLLINDLPLKEHITHHPRASRFFCS